MKVKDHETQKNMSKNKFTCHPRMENAKENKKKNYDNC